MVGVKTLLRWLRYESGFHRADEPIPERHARTSFSSTVFTGESDPWVAYLSASREARYDDAMRIRIQVDREAGKLTFQGQNELSTAFAEQLETAFRVLERRIHDKRFVTNAYNQAVFGNPSNLTGQLYLRFSPRLPCEASREVPLGKASDTSATNIVLRQSVVTAVMRRLAKARGNAEPDEHLGIYWPIVRRVLSQLSFPDYPRDRFVEKIEVTVTACLMAINVLYEGKRHQRLIPNRIGELFQDYASRRDEIPHDELFERHPYFRLLNEMSFMFDEDAYRRQASFARVLVREYLDGRYLRLSLAGVMPEVDESMSAMPFHQHDRKVSTPYPRLGRYGILDAEDLDAWKKVEGRFRDMGFVLIRQLGIGQFGRVYEALNQFNPHIPRRVALKIDRIIRGKKQEAIQSAEATMRIGEALATAPHVIRVFDAGKLKGKRYTYHVLQCVDGDTLDNLVGISGTEHSSMLRPRAGQRSVKEVQQDYLKAIKASTKEIWRRKRMTRPFIEPLNLSQSLDLLTSILLWLEEVHQLDFAVNDLKNGNLMVSRRGQLKGIDLDSYSAITSPMDRVTDYFFLAVSLALFLLNIAKRREKPMVGCEGLLQSRDLLQSTLRDSWSFGDVSQLSHGRVPTAEVIDLLVDLIERSRNHSYANDPAAFTQDIDRLIRLKRNIFATEIVLD